MFHSMHGEPDNHRHVRHVVLPSGKTIEVVYFEDPPSVAPRHVDDIEELHVCGSCGSHLVHPTGWEEAGATHWEVALRCPNCEWEGTGVFPQDVVDRFDDELDRGTAALVRDLKHLMHANMEDQVERFIMALEGDHIVPDDF